MAQSFSLEDALGGAPKPAAAPSKGFSLDDALGAKAAKPALPAGEDLAALITPTEDQPQTAQDRLSATPGGTLNAQDYLAAVAKRKQENPDRSASDVLVDSGITFLKATIGLPEAFLGLADIPTAGRIGKLLEQKGYKPKEAREILDTYLSQAQQAANRKVKETKGFGPTILAGLENPSVIGTAAIESLPQMLGGAAIARGLMKAAPAVPAYLAGAAGEGAIGAGSAAAQIRQESEDGLLSARQSLSAVGSGAGTALFGAVGGRLAKKLGLDDVDTMLASGPSGGKSKSVLDFAKRAGASGISEGVFEELPQSAQEKMWMNYATDRPLMDGVPEASAMGLLTGVAMGVAGTGAGQLRGTKDKEQTFSAEQMARERGFLMPTTRAERPAPAERPTPVQERVEPTFDEEAFVPPTPKATEDLTQQRAQEQADVLALEGEAKAPERFANMDEAAKYDTPEMRLKQAEALDGNDVTGLIFGETESYGRAALKKKSLTAGYAEKKDNRNDASDAATVAFGTGDYGVFAPYEKLFPKTAAKLKTALAPQTSPEPEAVTEETPQQKLKRLSSKSIGMTNAFRDRVITNQEYDKFESDLEAARQAVEQEAPDLSALSPAKREILEIADKLEAAGVKGFPRGMRSNARPEAREPDEKAMEFYRSKLQPYEEQQAPAEKKPYGLPEFFSDNEKEVARITGLMKSGPLKTRIALNEANDSIRRLADTIQAAGFDVNNLVPGQVPDGIMKIKSQIGNIAARSNRLAAAAEAVQKKYKRADPARVKSDAAELMADVEEADNLIAEDQNLPSAAEQMEGVAPPVSPEVEELLTKQRLANDDIQILSKRSSGTSLMKVLEGSLDNTEISELIGVGASRKIGKNPFASLMAKKGTRGGSIEGMIDSGKLNPFLPFKMRQGQPDYDDAESAEYIREKLRNSEFYTDDIRNEIENIQRGIWSIDEEIQQELSLEDINREIQYAVDEQRVLDQETAELAPEGALEALEESARAETEEDLIDTPAEEAAPIKDKKIRDKLMRIANNLGVQVFEVSENPMASPQGFISIPAEDKDIEGAITPEHVFAHELGHAIMQKRGMSFNQMSKEQIEKWIPGFASLKEISKKFRPAIWSHRLPKTRRHANKNDEIIADALGSYLLGESTKADIAPLIEGIGLSEYDLGEKKFDNVANEERLIAELNEKQKQREDEQLLRTQTEQELRDKQAEIDKVKEENERLSKEADRKAKADEEAGDFVLTGSKREADEAAARGQQTFLSISRSPVTGEPAKRAPSVTRRAKTLSRANRAGKISDMEFVIGVNAAIEAADDAKLTKDRPERQRGADFIRQKLLEAKRREDISEEASDLAEWFILNNPALVDDLGISIRMKKSGGTAGQYIPFSRIMVLMKGAANDQTPVHEILHHLERMMPTSVQAAIRKEWAKQLTQAKQKAATPDERKFFELLFQHHYHENGSKNDFDKSVEMIQEGKVPYEFYQYVNPSEFWAVNGSDIMQSRFDAVRGGVLQRLKSWLKELGQKVKSVFGVPSDAPLIRALDSLSKGDGEFVTKEMLGEATGYAAIAGKNIYDRKPMVNWTMPDSTNLDSFIYFMQNKQIDMKRAVEAIQQNVAKIDERFDPYMKETLFAGRTATQTKRFLQNELEPLFKEMGRLDVTMPELEEYLHNRHAPERNLQIAIVNSGMPDKGSGIATFDALDYMANLTPEQEAKYKKLAGMVDAIGAGTRQLLVDSGLESQDTINKWEETYDNYVPLNRDDIDYSSNHGMGVGQGYSVRGSASKRAVGSERKVVDILANIAMQRERNIVRAEKNRVAMALYGLAIQNPNPDVFLAVNPDAKKDIPAATQELVNMGFLPSDIKGLMNEPSTMEIDPSTGLAIERIHQMQRGADNVMGLRVNGENRYVFFNQNNERAQRMAMAIKNLDADKLGAILSTTADVTRFMAAMNTQYNPIFGAYNFLRDVSTAGLQLTNTPLAGKQKEVLNPKNVFGAMRGIYTDLRAERGGKAGTTQWSKLWEEFQQRGGQTGFRDQFSSTEKRGQALQRIIDPSSWADSGLGKVFTAGGALKVPFEVARKSAAPIFNWLSDYNETMENAIRLSAYKTALDNGMSKDAAAVLAKELTVNFNRKGQIATQAGALYAFFNASVQGTTALVKTLSGPAGKAIIGGGLMLGAIQAALYAMADFDEKEPPEFIREKNFVIPDFITKSGKYIAIPLPLGYNVIPNTSRLITEAVIRFTKGEKVKPVDTAFKIFESLLGAFNPIGNAGWSFQTAAPTVADPIVAIMENRDWTGKRIAREDFNSLDPTPGFTRYKESASAFSRGLAEFMNSMSGGTEDAPGRISPTPDQIDYLIAQIFGGVGREALKIERSIRSQFTGEELPPQAIPFAGRFYGDTKGSSAVSSAFYDNLKELNIHENTVKGMRKRKENVQEYFKENPEARMIDEAGRVEREVQALRKRRRELVEKEAPKESVRAIEERITTRMKRFNDKVKQREEQRK